MKFVLPLLLCLLAGCHRTPPAPQGPAFDVPNLLGRPPKVMEKKLGASPGVTSKVWQRNGAKLTAEFSASGLQTSLLLESDTPRDEAHRDELLKLGGINPSAPRAGVNFVETPGQPGQFSGVRVNLPKQHTVKFVVFGAEELVSITSGIAASGATILTIPPWHVTQGFNIGQTVSLGAQYIVKEGQPVPQDTLKVQICVDDGRVLKEATGHGVVRCELTL